MGREHLLHLSLDFGELHWKFECLDVGACSFPTVDENGDPMVPGECWLEAQARLWLEDWTTAEVLGSLCLIPVWSPVLVKVQMPGLGPECGPDKVILEQSLDGGA